VLFQFLIHFMSAPAHSCTLSDARGFTIGSTHCKLCELSAAFGRFSIFNRDVNVVRSKSRY